jgi:hypothetical protein
MSEINASIVKVENILSLKNLRIPEYQRPYRWETENVRQLLEDILTSKTFGKKQYRIGSVILHDNNTENSLDLVDGQQRITTLFLIKKACYKEDILSCNLRYNHMDSYNNIKSNYAYIDSWLDENCKENRTDYFKYISESCEFVKIVVSDLSEAFQMFDSQNGRGKELEPYNLLKAYHIRTMEQEVQEEKIKCDKRWEEATQYNATPKKNDPNIDILKQLFEEQLYRSRIWSRGYNAWNFSKKEIGEFKGFTIDKNHPAIFPFQNPQLLQHLTSKFHKNILLGTVATQNRFVNGDDEKIDPFVNITQQIVNGRPFFDYIETYVEIYKRMFIDINTYQLSEFKEFYYTFCLNYGVSGGNRKNDEFAFYPKKDALRRGDTYLREVYKSLVFVLFDKFGETILNKYFKVLYRIIYSNRITQGQVKYISMVNIPIKFFKIISDAKSCTDLFQLYQFLPNDNTNFAYEKRMKNETVRRFIMKGE